MTWLETFSGRRFSLLRPNPDDVWLPDVAHALARNNRFVGHTGKGYSVAEHSLWVWKLIALEYPEDYLFQFHGQFHDAHEYVTGDISCPMKETLTVLGGGEPLRRIEHSVQTTIYESFRLAMPTPEQKRTIKIADARMLATEHLCPALMPNGGTHRWSVDDHVEPHAGIRDGTVGLEPIEMLEPSIWDDRQPSFVRFPAGVALQAPPDQPTGRIPTPLTEDDVAFLFRQNALRLLFLIRAGQKPPA